MESDPTVQGESADDPVYVHARREALVAFLGWLVAGVISISISVSLGYDVDPAEMTLVLGVPLWVVLGVVAPWIVAVGFAVWFSLRFVRDEDLGSEPEGESDG